MTKQSILLLLISLFISLSLAAQKRQFAGSITTKAYASFPQQELEQRLALDTLVPPIFDDECSFNLAAFPLTNYWGRLGGMNGYGDKEKAQLLNNETNTIIRVNQGMAWFNRAKGVGNGNLRMKVYAPDGTDANGRNGAPGTLLGQSDDLRVSDIQVDDSLVVTTFFPFSNPVTLGDNSFYMSVDMADLYATNDTVDLLHTLIGCGNGLESYELWSDDSWNSMQDAWSSSTTTFDINFFIFAIVEFDDPSGVVDPYVLQNGLRLFPAAPNPARNVVRLGYELEESGPVQIEIYSPDGRQLQKINLGQQPAGRYAEEIAVGDFPVGSYIYGVVTDKSRLMSKFVVNR
ncbi:MAG: T9SS type A sorting domain-containing protein [Saprospiraceae bacterium]